MNFTLWILQARTRSSLAHGGFGYCWFSRALGLWAPADPEYCTSLNPKFPVTLETLWEPRSNLSDFTESLVKSRTFMGPTGGAERSKLERRGPAQASECLLASETSKLLYSLQGESTSHWVSHQPASKDQESFPDTYFLKFLYLKKVNTPRQGTVFQDYLPHHRSTEKCKSLKEKETKLA